MNDRIPGRGSTQNPGGRFEAQRFEVDDTVEPVPFDDTSPRPGRRTQFFVDHSRSAFTSNDSPDVGFKFSVNPYRGCEHGCIYCYARPTHEYLGLSAGIDFETKIFVKRDVAELLRADLLSRSWEPLVIVMSGVTDCYQPVERNLGLTRACLTVLNEFRNPVSLITKNHLILRDLDLLQEMAARNQASALITITSLDDELVGVLEPRTSRPAQRLRAIETLARAGVPVGVNVAPVIPGLTDHEMPAILKAAADAGATMAGYVPLRLPHGLTELFSEWLATHFPERKEKVLNRIRSLRGGKLYDADFKTRMTGQGVFADEMKQWFQLYTRKYGLNLRRWDLSTEGFRRVVDPNQLNLF